MSAFDLSNLTVPGIIFAALLAVFFTFRVLQQKLRAKYGKIVDVAFRQIHKPVEVLLVITAMNGVIGSLQFLWAKNGMFTQAVIVAGIAVVCWLAVRIVYLVAMIVVVRAEATKKDDVRARVVQAQARVLRRVAVTLIALMGAAGILDRFPGMTIPVHGLLILAALIAFMMAVAARRMIADFYAGMRLTMAQIVRIGDKIEMGDVRGTVTDMTMTHVVLKIPEGGHMVVPAADFVRKPFRRNDA